MEAGERKPRGSSERTSDGVCPAGGRETNTAPEDGWGKETLVRTRATAQPRGTGSDVRGTPAFESVA